MREGVEDSVSSVLICDSNVLKELIIKTHVGFIQKLNGESIHIKSPIKVVPVAKLSVTR